ncbi:hypothetical protein C8R43DRAFT_384296 [Mycena crocata]|nr:hypothetical protein C8R43DRAFT_384296 [Mycena crocata]
MADLRSLFENPPHGAHDLEAFRERIGQIVSETLARGEPGANQISPDQSRKLVSSLPRLTEEQVRDAGHHDSLCPICFTPFAAILAEEETALAMDSPAYPADQLGVTKLAETWQCGHLFCRRDISRWIQDAHGSCPMCRRSLVESSGNPTEAPSTTAPDDAELLSQIRSYMEQLHSNGAVAYVDHDGEFRGFGEALYTPEAGYADDRSDFSGMYS